MRQLYPGWKDLSGFDFIAKKKEKLQKLDINNPSDVVRLLMSGKTLFVRTPSAYFEIAVNPANMMVYIGKHDSSPFLSALVSHWQWAANHVFELVSHPNHIVYVEANE